MNDGVEIDDTREELSLLACRLGPSGDLLKNLGIASFRLIEARSVD